MNAELSKSDLNLMLDIIHGCLSCRNQRGYEALVETTRSLIPFDHIRSLAGDCTEYETKKMGAFTMLTAFPPEWEERYQRKDYLLYDNIALMALRGKGLIYWSDYARLEDVDDKRNAASRKIMDEAASIGLRQGWLYSMPGRRSSYYSVLSLAGEDCEKSARTRHILAQLSPHLCLAVGRIVEARRRVTARLTLREREVLSWAAAGKTAWETSEIMKISRRTVEFHMGNILNKLDAVNAQQAIAIAFSAGLITY